MTVPMVLWTCHRGHGPRPTIEMALAMYAWFVVLFPFLRPGSLDDTGVMMNCHVPMPFSTLSDALATRGVRLSLTWSP